MPAESLKEFSPPKFRGTSNFFVLSRPYRPYFPRRARARPSMSSCQTCRRRGSPSVMIFVNVNGPETICLDCQTARTCGKKSIESIARNAARRNHKKRPPRTQPAVVEATGTYSRSSPVVHTVSPPVISTTDEDLFGMIESVLEEEKQPIDFAALVLDGEFTSPQLVASDASSRKIVAAIPAMYSGARTPGELVNEPPAPAPAPEVPSLSESEAISDAELLEELRDIPEEDEDEADEDDIFGPFLRWLKKETEEMLVGYNPHQIDAASFLDDLPLPQSPPMIVIPLHASLLVDQEEAGVKRGYRRVEHSDDSSPVDDFSTVILRTTKRTRKTL